MGSRVPPPCCRERDAVIDEFVCWEAECCNLDYYINWTGSPYEYWPTIWKYSCESGWKGFCWFISGSPFWQDGHCWIPKIPYYNNCELIVVEE